MRSLIRRMTARTRPLPATTHVRRILDEACARTGLSARGAELVGISVNTVYRLAAAPVVVRIRPSSFADAVEDQVACARQLADAGSPVTRPLDVEQPVRVGRYVATFWEAAAVPTLEWQTARMGHALSALHAAPAPDRLLPWDPFTTVRRRVATITYLGTANHAWLAAETDRVEAAYQRAAPTLGFGVVHGDVHVANLLRGPDGRPVLADLDSVALGPQLVDLTPTAVDGIRFRMHKRQRAMVEAYGTDVTQHPAWPLLRRVRELSTTTFGLVAGLSDARVAALARHRLRTLQDDDHDARWYSYRDPLSVLDGSH